MDNQAIAQRLTAFLLAGAGLVFAAVIGWNIGSANYLSLILGSTVIGIGCIALFSGPFFWVFTIASSFLGGTFPILGGSFSPFQILVALGVTKFVVEDIILRRTRIQAPARFDLLMIGGFMVIITLHGIHDRFGMRFLGSTVWGGRNYINVFVGLAAFWVIQSIPMQSKIWAKLPYAVLAVATFDLFIAVITTIFPASIYKIYPFYSAVSLTGLEELTTGSADVTGRVGAFGNFGFIVITLVLAAAPLMHILSPAKPFRLISVIIAGVTVLYSGFRTSVLNAIVVTLLAGIRDLKFKVIALLPLLAIVLFTLSFLNSDVVRLPKQMQRGLAFLPGKWDTEMKNDVIASNDFRRQIWTIWAKDYFPAHPLLGRGFGFRSQWAQRSVFKYDPYEFVQWVEVGDIHNGFLAALDALGLVGTLFFVLWNVRLFYRALRVSFQNTDPSGLALRFLALYLATSILSYWMGAANLGTFLPREFALAGVFLRLQRDIKLAPKTALSSSEQEHSVPRSLAVT